MIEHICLLKANKDLSEEEEKDMLDFLYTTQYQMRGIVAVSMGESRLLHCLTFGLFEDVFDGYLNN